MNIIENKTGYEFEEIIGIAQRENNTKRSYLLVNNMQAKHVPALPEKTIDLFTQLGSDLHDLYGEETVTIIGFAETATAIGAAVASCFGGKTSYIHTTREKIIGCKDIVNFQEEHSHATEQKLFCSYPEEFIKNVDRIIFVEDEITTGKTILNFISALKENKYLNSNQKVAVASIVNGMNEANINKYRQLGIDINYLIKIEYNHQFNPFTDLSCTDDNKKEHQSEFNKPEINMYSVPGKIDPRKGVLVDEYENACNELAVNVLKIFEKNLSDEDDRILVVGSEEFMYPPILAAKKISEKFSIKDVKVHATTRSPIVPIPDENYPIKNRFELKSFYSEDRRTFIYNLEGYDKVILLTDSEDSSAAGFTSLINELCKFGNKEITGIRWVE